MHRGERDPMLHAWKLRLGAATLVATLAVSTLILGHGRGSSAAVAPPDLIQLPPKEFSYRANGEFTQAGRPVLAPMGMAEVAHGLAIMTRQVTAAEYGRCVEAGACPRTERDAGAADRPAVKVNWYDAQAYAAWLSRETGQHFRLPTDEEWSYAAADRVTDNAIVKQNNPGQRAVASYEFEANLTGDLERELRPIGSFGANENGLLDLAGNVWEWTDTCFDRHALDAEGRTLQATSYCGIRIAEGRHRAYMLDFVRDSRNGGCSVGTPPTNLGFRLVRSEDDPWHGLWSLMTWAQHRLGFGA
jgi:formylglycine-generating enzyme required for sulfatase activity